MITNDRGKDGLAFLNECKKFDFIGETIMTGHHF